MSDTQKGQCSDEGFKGFSFSLPAVAGAEQPETSARPAPAVAASPGEGATGGFKGFSFAFTAQCTNADQSPASGASEEKAGAPADASQAWQGEGTTPATGFKGFSFAFAGLNSHSDADQNAPSPQVAALSPQLALAHAQGVAVPQYAITTASLEDASVSTFFEGSSRGSFADVQPFAASEHEYNPEDTWLRLRPPSETVHSLKAKIFNGGDPCPSWTGVLASNPRYPIPMMGETKKRIPGTDSYENSVDANLFAACKAEWAPTMFDPSYTEATSRSWGDQQAAQAYLSWQTKAALNCLEKLTKLERMKALSFPLEDHQDSRSCNFSTMVHVAAYRCDVPTLQALVELTGPAVLCVQDGLGSSPLAEAIVSPFEDMPATLKYLLKLTPDDVLLEADFIGNTLLSWSVLSHRLCRVEAVVNRHPPTDWRYLSEAVSQVRVQGNENVHVAYAIASAPADIVIYLLKVLPPDVFFWKDKNGQSNLHEMFCTNFQSFKALFEVAGPDLLKEESFGGKTLLHKAAESGHSSGVQFLLDEMEMEDICRKCKVRGALALHYAVRKRNEDVVRMLVATMPPQMRFEPDSSGYSAMQLAEEIEASPSGGDDCRLVDALAMNITKGAM